LILRKNGYIERISLRRGGYWHNGRVWITLNEFYLYNDRYHCERSYLRIIGDKIKDFENMKEAEITS